jgi:hypothetical protein
MTTLDEIRTRFTDQLQFVDDVAQVILKGHLVVEEVMTESIRTFVHHGDLLEECRLQFHQKLQLCKAMSVSDQNNEMWNLISSINALRNHLSHSLDVAARHKRIAALEAKFSQQFADGVPENLAEMPKDTAICMLAIAGAIGYLHAHLEEVQRFREVVVQMDRVWNTGKLGEA